MEEEIKYDYRCFVDRISRPSEITKIPLNIEYGNLFCPEERKTVKQ